MHSIPIDTLLFSVLCQCMLILFSVSRKTNYLIVGRQDKSIVGEDGMSSKQEKAMKLKDAGQDIEIMSESEFRLLMSKSNKRKSSNVDPILFA